MRAVMPLIKDRHGTYYARHKVPECLQEVVAVILGNGKAKQLWLKKSLGTKVLSEANVRAKPVQTEFDRIIARADERLNARPVRPSLSHIEIKRMASAHKTETPLRCFKSIWTKAVLTTGCSAWRFSAHRFAH
jgi:hypothetical protein